MSIFSSSSAFEKKKLVGEWWIPNQEKRCFGSLYFDLDGEQKLCIAGNFDNCTFFESSRVRGYDVIHGICRVGNTINNVTVLDAVYTNHSMSMNHEASISESTLSFQDVWIGTELYDSRDDIVFSSFYFGLNNLAIWHDFSRNFTSEVDDRSKTITAKLVVPEPITFFSDENVAISIDYGKQLPDRRIGQTESTIRCAPQIRISANNGSLPYYGKAGSFEHYLFFVFQMFELFIWGQTFFFCMRGYLEKDSSEGNNKLFPVCEELLFPRDITSKQRKTMSAQDDVMFSYPVIKNCLSDLAMNFHHFYNSLRVILDSALSSICRSSYGLNSLPLLLFSVEGLQQIFYHSLGESTSPENISDYTAFDSLKQEIIQLCNTNELKSFAKREIRWGKSFRDRLFAIFLDLKAVFSFFDDDICNSLAKDLTKLRNDAAHSDERDFDQILTPLYRSQHFFVQFLHIAIIMKACGLPPEIIRRRFEVNYLYQSTSAFLRDHYATNRS